MKQLECYVLTGRGKIQGRIVHAQPDDLIPADDIAIVPHAGAAYDLILRQASAVITLTGSRLCHLAIVARELGKRVVRVTNAHSLLPNGTAVIIDCDNDTVHLLGDK